MSDSLSVVNETALAVAPGGQLIEPGSPVAVDDTAEVRELLDAGVLSLKTGRKTAKTTNQED